MSVGRDEEALPIQHEALEQRKAGLGPAHLGVITVALNMAALNYPVSPCRLGRGGQALPFKRVVWEQRKAALGPAHFDIIMVALYYSESLVNCGRGEEALHIHARLCSSHSMSGSSARSCLLACSLL